MSVTERRLQHILLLALAIQSTVLVVAIPEFVPLLYVGMVLTLVVVGRELFWLLDLNRIVQ